MKFFLTGATGVIGRRVVPLLVKAGHDVTGVARSDESAKKLEQAGVKAVQVDLFDEKAVRQAAAGHETICNLATSIPSGPRVALPFAWSENDRIRRVVSKNLVDAALEAGARRYIQESFAMIYPDSGDAWIDENVPVKPANYVRSVIEAENQAQRFTDAGRTGVVLRFGLFYGNDSSHTLDMIRFVNMGIAFGFGSPDGYVSSLSTDDAARAVVAALQVPAGIYNAADDEPVRKREYFDSLAGAVVTSSPNFLPSFVRYLLGSMGETLARSLRISNRKLKEASGWQPIYPSIREGFTAIVKQIAAQKN